MTRTFLGECDPLTMTQVLAKAIAFWIVDDDTTDGPF